MEQQLQAAGIMPTTYSVGDTVIVSSPRCCDCKATITDITNDILTITDKWGRSLAVTPPTTIRKDDDDTNE